MGDLLRYRYFPVMHSDLAADIEYIPLNECEMDLGDGINLKTKYLNHPLLCLGYRFEFKGKVLCTAYDTEPFRNLFPTDKHYSDYNAFPDEMDEETAKEANERLLKFYKDSDILIHDCQYTREEYFSAKIGWGHSFFEYAIDSAIQANVKKLILFHHDPSRKDSELLALEKHYRHRLEGQYALEIETARERMEINL